LFYLFFFFQAEDGIRDFHVTGVQTCALPISKVIYKFEVKRVISGKQNICICINIKLNIVGKQGRSHFVLRPGRFRCWRVFRSTRSEERRVGKEGRCRGGGDETEKLGDRRER